jgi:hypothetical protein
MTVRSRFVFARQTYSRPRALIETVCFAELRDARSAVGSKHSQNKQRRQVTDLTALNGCGGSQPPLPNPILLEGTAEIAK